MIADLEHPREFVHQPFFARVLARDQRLPLRDVDPPSKIGVRYVRLRDVVDMDGVNRFIEILGGHLVLCSHIRLRLAEQALRDEQQDRLATLDSIVELRLPLAPVSQPVVVPKWNVVMRKRFDQWSKTLVNNLALQRTKSLCRTSTLHIKRQPHHPHNERTATIVVDAHRTEKRCHRGIALAIGSV